MLDTPLVGTSILSYTWKHEGVLMGLLQYRQSIYDLYPIFVDIGLTVDVDPNAVQNKDSHKYEQLVLDRLTQKKK